MTRLIHWISNVVREPAGDSEVHFHSGPQATPTVCFDSGCRAPRLDVGTG
jgi:hypothetical protein